MAIKIDIHEGTRLRVGVYDHRYTTASRVGRATGLTTSRTALADAITELLADVTIDPHPDIPDLPLQWVEATRFGATKAWLRLGYGYGRGTNVTIDPKLACRTTLYAEPLYIWRSFRDGAGQLAIDEHGLPQGLPYFSGVQASDLSVKPPARVYPRPTLRVEIPTTLFQHPLASVGGLVKVVNEDKVTFGGLVLPPGWVRFDGMATDVLDTRNGYRYPTNYVFTVAKGGHWEQELVQDPQGSGKWVTRSALNHLEAPFGGAFPYSN